MTILLCGVNGHIGFGSRHVFLLLIIDILHPLAGVKIILQTPTQLHPFLVVLAFYLNMNLYFHYPSPGKLEQADWVNGQNG